MFVDDQDQGMCSTPKLPVFSFPAKRAIFDTPGLATPPVNVAGTVPFLWEEAPGKPRRSCDNKEAEKPKPKGGVVRCLDLPPAPRMLLPGEFGGKTAENEPSPTTVLDGLYAVGRRSLSLPRTASFKKGGPSVDKAEKGLFGGSTRWGSSLRKSKEFIEGKFDFSRSTDWRFGGGCDRGLGGGGIKVKISRFRRKRSFLMNLSHAKSHFWTRIYEGFKQAIPWRRRQDQNLRRTSVKKRITIT